MFAIAAVVLLLGAFTVACDDDGDGVVSLDEYFQQLDELDDEFEAASTELDNKIEASEDLDEIRGYMGDQVGAFDDFIGGLEELDPPAETEEPHNDAIEGLKDFRDELSTAVDEAGDAETVDALFASFDDLDFTGLEQAQTACNELAQIAADNSITVDLNCDEDALDDGGGEATPTAEDGTDGEEETPEDGDGTDGGDSAALEEYFELLDEAENSYRTVSDEASDALSDPSTTVDEAADVIADIKDAIDGFVVALEDIEPAAETQAAHEETIAGFQAVSGLLEELLPTMEDAETLEEALAPLNTEEFASISTSLDATCNALQEIADTNGIEVDLGCN
jgi:hypothetical protein